MSSIVASIRKEIGSADPDTLFGEVLALCDRAEIIEVALQGARETFIDLDVEIGRDLGWLREVVLARIESINAVLETAPVFLIEAEVE